MYNWHPTEDRPLKRDGYKGCTFNVKYKILNGKKKQLYNF